MIEGKAYFALPHFLKGYASTPFCAMQNEADSRGVSSWLQASQYFLRTYETHSAIGSAIGDLHSICPTSIVNETAFVTRRNHAA